MGDEFSGPNDPFAFETIEARVKRLDIENISIKSKLKELEEKDKAATKNINDLAKALEAAVGLFKTIVEGNEKRDKKIEELERMIDDLF